jgi:predicted RNA binding protein YcfA (HicA-like mRNA interferase family)
VKLPRDLSGADLIKALQKAGYVVTRQKGSHIRLTTSRNGEHHVSVPNHDALKVGTLAGILHDVAQHLGLHRAELLQEMFGRAGGEKRKGKTKRDAKARGDMTPPEATA